MWFLPFDGMFTRSFQACFRAFQTQKARCFQNALVHFRALANNPSERSCFTEFELHRGWPEILHPNGVSEACRHDCRLGLLRLQWNPCGLNTTNTLNPEPV